MAALSTANSASAQEPDQWLEPVINTVELYQPPTVPEMVCQLDWPCDQALSVMDCESHGNPDASDGGFNVGLFQISPRWQGWRLREGESLYDPEVNIRIAHEIYVGRGRYWSGTSGWPYCGRFW